MSNVEFTSEYYTDIIHSNGYDVSVFDGFTQDLPGIERTDLERIFLCHKGLYEFRDTTEDKAILTGFGLSGVPHLGTLAQMNRAALLNQAGYFTELILGDLDAYNGKRTPFDKVRQLSTTYQRFIENSDLLSESNSRVRNQYDSPEVLRTAYMLGRYASDELFENAQEDLHELYVSHGKVDATTSYPRKLSLNLMIADFFHLGQTHPQVMVMLGLDEHQYVRAAQQLATAVDTTDPAFSPVAIHSLYTPIIQGLRGYPKMSKSFPESGITLDMPAKAISRAILDEPDTFAEPEQSVVFQIACGVGTGEGISLSEVYSAATAKQNAWTDIKHAIIGRITAFADIWQKASQP